MYKNIQSPPNSTRSKSTNQEPYNGFNVDLNMGFIFYIWWGVVIIGRILISFNLRISRQARVIGLFTPKTAPNITQCPRVEQLALQYSPFIRNIVIYMSPV